MLSFSFYPFSFSTTSQMAENVARVQVNSLPRPPKLSNTCIENHTE